MPLAVIIAAIVVGFALNLGFFFTRAMNREVAITMFGTFIRVQRPAAYWAWRAYWTVSFLFNILLAIAIIIGLLQ